MKYSVLVKRVVNVRVDAIEAASQTDAINKVEELVNFARIFNKDQPSLFAKYTEDAEESAYYLVDEEGDEDFAKSRWYAQDGVTELPDHVCSMCGRVKEKSA